MSIVSISEAARLTGKARSTIQTYIKTGKISKTTDNHTGNIGIETSEIIRVFGNISIQNITDTTGSENVVISQQTTGNTTDTTSSNTRNATDKNIEILQLKLENEKLKSVLEAKQETIDTLKSALKLLEYKQPKNDIDTKIMPDKEPEQTLSSPIEAPLIDTMEPVKPSTGFWGGLRKLFK